MDEQQGRQFGRAKATTCRYCGEGGNLDHGAHLRCKYLAKRFLKRTEGPCARCVVKPRLLTSKYGLCRECSEENKKASIKAANHRWYLRKKSQELPPAPPCKCGCGKPVEDRRRRLYATKECMEKVSNAKHIAKQKAARGAAKKAAPKPKPKFVERDPKRVQERPYAESRPITELKPEVIIVPPHVTVTRIAPPPVFARGLRNLFGDENGQTWCAVD